MMKLSRDTISLRLLPLLAMVGFASAHDNSSTSVAEDSSVFSDYGLTMELYSTNPIENECTSSLGVSMALSLIYPSAIADSEIQMRTILGYPTPPEQSMLLWERTTKSLTSRYGGRCYNLNTYNGDCFGKEPTLAISNSVFVDETLTLNETYVAVVGDLVQQLDFSNDMAGSFINHWVNETTNGLIDSIVEDGPLEDLHLMAVNSIYLKASWIESFNEVHTNQDLFYSTDSSSSSSSDAHFMHQVEMFPYSHDALPGYQILQLGFTGDSENDSNKLSMIFVLPILDDMEEQAALEKAAAEEEDTTASSLLASGAEVLQAIPMLERTRVAVGIPKFRFEAKYEDDLKEALQTMGMTAPFDSNLPNNFCIQEGSCHSFINSIIQKTFIDVNEKGVEAAAATAVGLVMMSAPIFTEEPILFLADHPFQFFLYDDKAKLMLFEGQVGNPGIPEGSVATNQGKHDSGNKFWQEVFGVNPTSPAAASESEIEVEEPEEGEEEMPSSKPEEEGMEEEEEETFANEGEYDVDVSSVTSTTKIERNKKEDQPSESTATTTTDAVQEEQEQEQEQVAATDPTTSLETASEGLRGTDAITNTLISSGTTTTSHMMMRLLLPLMAGFVFLLD